MSTSESKGSEGGGGPSYKPFVPADTNMREFTVRAVLIGLVMCVILGAANAYLGLKAGMTIAATYPAAVIGMALLRLFKGSILEENMSRTVGSIGESIAAGAIFTVPAFVIAGVWTELRYWEAAAIMFVGGVIGIFFVTMLRRVMVEDVELPYPESVAASEIHKAGRSGGTGAIYLLLAGLVGAAVQAFKELKLFASSWEHFVHFASRHISLRTTGTSVPASGGALLSSPGVSPAYMGVGYIIGPKLAALNFTGGLLAWGLFVPVLLYFMGPTLPNAESMTDAQWIAQAGAVWRFIVRPIAIGGMLLSAVFTLYRMRANLITGLKRSVGDLKKAAVGGTAATRTERDINFKYVLGGIILAGVATFFLYNYFAQDVVAALVATVVMIVAGFFFAAVSGYLVGMIGSSNNPISGLTLSTVIVAALLMYALGQSGTEGIAAVLGVAGVICVSAAVAGEMLQDLKVGHILGGTPWKMQVGDLLGVAVSAAVMFFPILILHQGDIANYMAAHPGAPPPEAGVAGLGGPNLPAPQAGLMAMVSQGIIGGDMAWPLIVLGMIMAAALILVQVKSPMLVCVGMYLPLETTFAIFIGGLFRGVVDMITARRKCTAGQLARVENNGVLLASGLIAGEALMGLVFAGLAFGEIQLPELYGPQSFIKSILLFFIIGAVLVVVPVLNAGDPDTPAPKMG